MYLPKTFTKQINQALLQNLKKKFVRNNELKS